MEISHTYRSGKSVVPAKNIGVHASELFTPLSLHPQVPVVAEVKFPSVDEEFGMVEISWRVGDSVQDGYKYTALTYLLDFLTEKIISPLSKGEALFGAWASVTV